MPPEITRLADAFLHNPVRVEVSRAATTAENITQTLVPSGGSPEEKRSTLRRIIHDAKNFKNALIFCNRKRDVQVVYRSLQKHGFSVLALHGDLDQRMRMAALDAFRNGEVQLLVCSDVAARGLDIPDVSHVINYDAPHHSEDYVHRIGRTGRAGKSGEALTIVSRTDQKAVAEIEKLIARKIDWQEGAQLPPDEEVEAPSRERSRGRGGARRGSERAAPVEAGERPDRHAEHRADSRHHHAARPARERVDADQEDASSPAPARPRRQDPPTALRAATARARERSAAGPAYGEAPRASSSVDRAPRGDRPRRDAAQPRRDDDAPVVGLGDHVPDFLLRPVKARPRPRPSPSKPRRPSRSTRKSNGPRLRLEGANRHGEFRWPGSVSIRL